MARIKLIEEQDHPELAPLIGRIKGARGRLINLYGALLHSPAVAEGWMAYNDAVRQKTAIDDRMRELVTMRVAILNDCDYVLSIHRARYAAPAGVSAVECDALADWHAAKTFSARERAVLAYTDAMTRDAKVPDSAFRAVREHYDESATVELTVIIAAYNMHTRFLNALEVDPEK